jgi:hypothetical protein
MSKKYAVVSSISTFRHYYVVDMDTIQALNPEGQVSPEWLADCVVMEEVEEFSQTHVGEQILDVLTMNEDEVLELFDNTNSYLSSWSREQKLKWIHKLNEGLI